VEFNWGGQVDLGRRGTVFVPKIALRSRCMIRKYSGGWRVRSYTTDALVSASGITHRERVERDLPEADPPRLLSAVRLRLRDNWFSYDNVRSFVSNNPTAPAEFG